MADRRLEVIAEAGTGNGRGGDTAVATPPEDRVPVTPSRRLRDGRNRLVTR